MHIFPGSYANNLYLLKDINHHLIYIFTLQILSIWSSSKFLILSQKINLRLPNWKSLQMTIYLTKMAVLYYWENEKLLVTSNFSISCSVPSVFKWIVLQARKNNGLFKEGLVWLEMRQVHIWCLTHYHTMLHFDTLQIYSCGIHCEKGEIACYKQLFLFSQCFLP